MTKIILFLLASALSVLQVLSQTDQSTGKCLRPYSYQCVGQNHFRECSIDGPVGPIFPCSLVSGHTCYPYEYDKSRACGSALPNCLQEGRFPILENGVQTKCMVYQLCSSTGTDNVYKSDVMECRTGYEFSKSEKKCVSEEYADCSIPYQTTVPSTIPTTPVTTVPTTLPPPICPSTGQTKVADPNDCRYYYTCNEGVSTRNLCPFNMLFNIPTRSCSSSTDCGTRHNSLATTPAASTTTIRV